jgi:hypothetical protein
MYIFKNEKGTLERAVIKTVKTIDALIKLIVQPISLPW